MEKARQQYLDHGLTPEEAKKALEPARCFHAQLDEEISWYENVRRGRFTPIKRLTEIGRLLIALRIASGLTQRQLAERLRVNESSISRDEKNEYHGITFDRAQRIIDALQANITMTSETPVSAMKAEVPEKGPLERELVCAGDSRN